MFLSLLVWLDQTPWCYWTFCGLVYAVVLILALRPSPDPTPEHLGERRASRWIRSDTAFIAALACMLFVFRWPALLDPQHLSVDESWFISHTLTARQFPMFWKPIVAGSSGPINIYVRLLPALLGIPDSYLASRVMALLVVLSAVAAFYFMCRRLAPLRFARVATLAPTTFLALTTNGDFIHFSGEHVPVLLLAVASYLALQLSESAMRTSALAFLAGCVLGAAPLAKLQAGVLSLTIAIFCYVFLLRRKEALSKRWQWCRWLTLGGGTLPAAVVLLAIVGDGLEHFWQSYLMMNLGYAANAGSWPEIIAAVPTLPVYMPDFFAYFTALIAAGTMGLVWITVRGGWRRLHTADRRLLTFSSVVLAVAIFTVLAPDRPYPHYFLFLVLPVAGWAFAVFMLAFGKSAGQLRPRKIGRMAMSAWCSVCLVGQGLCYAFTTQPRELRGHVREFIHTPRSEVAEAILRHASPGQPLGLWGWMYQYHVETGMRRATSDTVLEYLWMVKTEGRQVSSWRELVPVYFQDLYLEELKRTRPPVFVDAVAPGSFIFTDRRTLGYETFPALANYIDLNYELAHEIEGVRIFVRK